MSNEKLSQSPIEDVKKYLERMFLGDHLSKGKVIEDKDKKPQLDKFMKAIK